MYVHWVCVPNSEEARRQFQIPLDGATYEYWELNLDPLRAATGLSFYPSLQPQSILLIKLLGDGVGSV